MNLRELLWTVAASTSLSACCIRDGWWEEQTYVMPPSEDGHLGELIAQCRTSDDCEALCTYHWSWLSDDNPEGDSDVRNCKRSGDTLTYEGYATCVAGRRPAGYRLARPRGTAVGAYLAAQAALEAASVRAFADLLADLVAHDAPRALRDTTVQAAADEVRHAELCSYLARRHGVRTEIAASAPAPRRTLTALAIDNVVEGCVRETFGAVIAMHQARHAADPAIRAAMHAIAADEARHAQLAWQLHRWLAPRLDARDRAELADRAAHARAQLGEAPHPDVVRVAGVPDRAAQLELLAALDRSVLSWRALRADRRSPGRAPSRGTAS